MKPHYSILLILAVLAGGLPLRAQTIQSTQSIHYDTLMPPGLETGDPFCSSLVVNCLRPDCRKGYVTGNNRFGLREVLMKYRYRDWLTRVRRVMVRTGRKVMANAASPTYAVFYRCGPDGYPDTVTRVQSVVVPFGQVRENNYTSFAFSPEVDVQADSFFVGFVLPTTAGDTVGVAQTPNRSANPCAALNDTLAYERGANSSFGRIYDNGYYGQVLFELAIQVDIEYQALAVQDRLARLIQLKPNPASEAVSIQVSEELGPVSWQLVAPDGRVVRTSVKPETQASWQIQRSGLPLGVYLLRLETRQGPVCKRIVFVD